MKLFQSKESEYCFNKDCYYLRRNKAAHRMVENKDTTRKALFLVFHDTPVPPEMENVWCWWCSAKYVISPITLQSDTVPWQTHHGHSHCVIDTGRHRLHDDWLDIVIVSWTVADIAIDYMMIDIDIVNMSWTVADIAIDYMIIDIDIIIVIIHTLWIMDSVWLIRPCLSL